MHVTLDSTYTEEEFKLYLEDSRSKILSVPTKGYSSVEKVATNLRFAS
jgi:hypothetical protein